MLAFHIPAPSAYDRLLAAAAATALHILTSPTGAALPPEPPAPPRHVSDDREAYTVGYRAVALARDRAE